MSLKNHKNLVIVAGVAVALLAATALLGSLTNIVPAGSDTDMQAKGCPAAGKGGCPMSAGSATCGASAAGQAATACAGGCSTPCSAEKAEGCCPTPCPTPCTMPCCAGEAKEGCCGTTGAAECCAGAEKTANQ